MAAPVITSTMHRRKRAPSPAAVGIYVPAGAGGIYALAKATGSPLWHVTATSFNATPAYDPATGALFAGGADGNLYKIDASAEPS